MTVSKRRPFQEGKEIYQWGKKMLLGLAEDNNAGGGGGGGRFDEEWFWVFGYGIVVVLVVISNLLLIISVGRNSFLNSSNANRTLAALAARNLLRSLFSLAVLYTTRWVHTAKTWKRKVRKARE